MSYLTRCILCIVSFTIAFSLWCIEDGRSSVFVEDNVERQNNDERGLRKLGSRYNISALASLSVRISRSTGDVEIVPTSETYLCAYMFNATSVPGGCVQACAVVGRFGPVSFNCYVRNRRSSILNLKEADILINHVGPVPRRGSIGPPYLTLFYSGESNQTDKKRGNDLYQHQYDMVVSFEHHRTYYYTWTHRSQGSFMKIMNNNIQDRGPTMDMLWSEWQARLSGVAVFVSRCKGRRGNLIRELSLYYTVHSFGKCSRTRRIPHDCQRLERYEQKLCVFRKYKYVLAMENSQEKDYVTEKVYHGLLSGAIPLYWGAPNINEFVPAAQKSFVDLNKFLRNQLGDGTVFENAVDAENRMRNLAGFMRHLEKDKVAVTRLFEWRLARRAEDWGKEFWDNLHHEDPICSICNEARVRRDE